MRKLLYLIGLIMFLGACNNDVFVPRPSDTPDIVEPDPDPDPEPESDDSLRVVGFKYDDASLKVSENILTYQAETTFINNTNYRGATILFDNYNNSVVRISSNTYWVLPWVTEPEYMIDIPGIKDGIPGFYGEKAPFKIGSFAIPYQYMPGHKEYFDLPPHSKVTAVVTYNRRRVRATGILTYEMIEFPETSRDSAQIQVDVEFPVYISVEWGEIKPAE